MSNRAKQLQKKVLQAVVYYLQGDLDGRDELLMKEVYEDCLTTEEFDTVYKEMKDVISLLKARMKA